MRAHEVQAFALVSDPWRRVRRVSTSLALALALGALVGPTRVQGADTVRSSTPMVGAPDLPARVEVIRASTRVNALAGGLQAKYAPLMSGVTRVGCDAFVQHAHALDRAFAELEVAWRGWGEVGDGFVPSSVAQVLAQRLGVSSIATEVQRRCAVRVPEELPGDGESVRQCVGQDLALSSGLVVLRARGARLPTTSEETVRVLLALGRRVVTSATHVVIFRAGPAARVASTGAGASLALAAPLSDLVSARRSVARFSAIPSAGAFDWPEGGVLGLRGLRLVVPIDSAASLRDGHATFSFVSLSRVVRPSSACGPQAGPVGWSLSDIGGVLGGARPGSLQPVPDHPGRWRGAPTSGSRVGLAANPGGVTPLALAEKYILGLSPVAATRPTRWLTGIRRVDALTFEASSACLLSPEALSARLVPTSPPASTWRLLGILLIDESTAFDDASVLDARAAWRSWTWPGVDADPERLNLFEASEGLWLPALAEVVPRQGSCALAATSSGSE